MSAKVSYALEQTEKQTLYKGNLLCFNIHKFSKIFGTPDHHTHLWTFQIVATKLKTKNCRAKGPAVFFFITGTDLK